MLTIHNEATLDFIKSSYALQDIQALSAFLHTKGIFSFSALDNGLFPAAKVAGETAYTGYANIWVRDNIHVAHACYVLGDTASAAKNVTTLMRYFKKHKHRFETIIAGKADPQIPMNRPHIRFNGVALEEIDQKWAHAQNDALGYFLWFYCKLACEGVLQPQHDDIEVLLLFPEYWQAVRYWQDEDSGHWEETRKISASSIGVVVAALAMLKQFIDSRKSSSYPTGKIEKLMQQGQKELDSILPSECIQNDPTQKRRYDSALLFLIYPLAVLPEQAADQVLSDVTGQLQGDYGIRRYLGDSYWSADYKDKISPEKRTADFSDDLSARDSLLKQGEEAQWCIFDPIISAIFGDRYQKTGCTDYLEKQTHYLNRSLGQLTEKSDSFVAFLCPESYYLENGRYVPNDATPLLWTQANLSIALKMMEKSLSRC